MFKKNFKVEYCHSSNISDQEVEFKLFKALEILINLDDIYDKKNNI